MTNGSSGGRRRRIGRLARARLPEAAPAGLRVEELEAAHRRREERIVHHRDEGDPPGPAILAVGDCLDPGALLQGDCFEDGPVLDRAQLVRADRPGARGVSRLAQVLGSQEAADDVRADGHLGRDYKVTG